MSSRPSSSPWTMMSPRGRARPRGESSLAFNKQITAEFINEVAVRASPVGELIEPLIVWRADERLEIVPEI